MTTALVHIERILCPTDFSAFSSRALRHAVALARQFRAELTALHVIPTFRPCGAKSPYFPAPVGAGRVLRLEAEAEMSRFVKAALDARLPLQTVIREGQPAQEIETLAEQCPPTSWSWARMGAPGSSGLS